MGGRAWDVIAGGVLKAGSSPCLFSRSTFYGYGALCGSGGFG